VVVLLLLKDSLSLCGLYAVMEHFKCQCGKPLWHTVNPAKEGSSLGISKRQCQEYDEGHGKHFPTAHGMEVSSWPKSDRCTLPAEQPQIGAVITESRCVMMILIINHFPVCL